MFHHDDLLLQLRGNLDQRRQDHQERPIVLSRKDLLGNGLDDLGGIEKPVKIHQNQNGGTVRCCQGIDGPDCCQGIGAASILGLPIGLAGDLQSLFHIPDCHVPVLFPAQFSNLGYGIFMFMGL